MTSRCMLVKCCQTSASCGKSRRASDGERLPRLADLWLQPEQFERVPKPLGSDVQPALLQKRPCWPELARRVLHRNTKCHIGA